MECKNARLLLEFARPTAPELDAGDAAALENHLADCPDCAAAADHERRLDAPIARAMQAVPVPADLGGRLLRRLAVERDAWYRRLLLRCLGVAAAAAALVLLVWGGWLWHATAPQEIAWGEVVLSADRPTGSPEKVEEWFRDNYGIRPTAPGANEFDYSWLAYYDLGDFCGRRVPMLLFAYSGPDGQARAQVYIVTDAQFRGLHDELNQPPRGSGGYKVKVLRNRDDPDVYYVIVYTEGAEGRFWSKRKPPL